MTRLNALLGILSGAKSRAKSAKDTAHHLLQKGHLFNGFVKTYSPLDDENGDHFPDESQLVQHNVETELAELVGPWARMIDLQASVDRTNQEARAQIALDGFTSEPLPASTLLWLEKELTDLRTIISKAPVLDPAKQWEVDDNSGLFTTEPRRTIKTRKVPKNHVRFRGDEHHPPQVDVFNADETVGHWTGVDLSGALKETRKRELLVRVDDALEAVKLARDGANQTEAVDIRVGNELLQRLLA
jgi:hypothetical protein